VGTYLAQYAKNQSWYVGAYFIKQTNTHNQSMWKTEDAGGKNIKENNQCGRPRMQVGKILKKNIFI
jgi:hypothetical protein